MTEMNNKIDDWVVTTFNPLLERFGYKTTGTIRNLGLIWLVIFFGTATVLWAIMLSVYIKTGHMPPNASTSTWNQIILCGVGLLGYYVYIFIDRILINEEIKGKN